VLTWSPGVGIPVFISRCMQNSKRPTNTLHIAFMTRSTRPSTRHPSGDPWSNQDLEILWLHKPMILRLPFLPVTQLQIKISNHPWNELAHLEHGNVAPDAGAGAETKLIRGKVSTMMPHKSRRLLRSTHRHPVPIHGSNSLLVLLEPPVWVEAIRIVAEYRLVAVFNPAVDPYDGLEEPR
jgi:hypothetical protein